MEGDWKKVDKMLISTGNLSGDSLKGQVVVVTGAGRGIGFETAKALTWLGASVVIAEIDEKNGKQAIESLEREFGKGKASFIKTDVGNEKDIEQLAEESVREFGKVDTVLNNATVFPIGAVKDKSIEAWDVSYRVNLRGPVLLAQTFLPGMVSRKNGSFVCVSSSGAAPFMGPYKVFKTAQVELANTIAVEVEGTGVYAFTIGPGIVRTPGFLDGGSQVASLMNLTLDQLLEVNKRFEISPEAAGTGFAASIALASKYHGQEIGSIQVLRDIGIALTNEKKEETISGNLTDQVPELYGLVQKTYVEQSEGWKKRNLFERQWVLRDFKKTTGMSVDEMLTILRNMGDNAQKQASIGEYVEPLKRLSRYYEHQ